MIELLTGTDVTQDVKLFSYIGLAAFGVLVIVFIGLHIWWSRKHKAMSFEQVGNNSIIHFLKVNIFAVFATLWAAGLFSAIMALISFQTS